MKKNMLILVMAFIITAILITVPVFASQNVAVKINNMEIVFDVPPVIESGRVLVPLRGIFEKLGAKVSWDPETSIVHAEKGDDSVKIEIGLSLADKNGEAVVLDVPPKIIDGRTMVPLRFVSEALGAEVVWSGETQTVNIKESAPENVKTGIQSVYTKYENGAVLKLPGAILEDDTGNQLFETRYMGNTKYIIKFDTVLADIHAEQIILNDQYIKMISVSKDAVSGKTTIVIESSVRMFYLYNAYSTNNEFEILFSDTPSFDFAMEVTPAQSETTQTIDPVKQTAVTLGDKAAMLALEQLGIKYVWGGSSPAGFDCSGLMYYVYRQFGITLPRIADAQSKSGKIVSISNLLPGDLVFFYTDTSDPTTVSHAGMYIGNGEFVHASSSAKGVIISRLFNSWYSGVYQGARRYWE